MKLCPGEGVGVGQPLYSNHCDLCLSQVRMSRSTWAILISENGLIAELSFRSTCLSEPLGFCLPEISWKWVGGQRIVSVNLYTWTVYLSYFVLWKWVCGRKKKSVYQRWHLASQGLKKFLCSLNNKLVLCVKDNRLKRLDSFNCLIPPRAFKE